MKAEGRSTAGMSDYDQKKAVFRQRTKQYAARVIRLFCALPKGRVELQVLGRQLLRSGTSVAANYRESSRARSSAEFVSKIDLCAQEADESMLWLELLRDECGISSADLDWVLQESDELIAIFVTMSKKVKASQS
jgi:four helix bundle protein